jgi:hemoglobin
MKTDISSRKDIELLVNSFYKLATKDKIIGVFFTEVVQMQWEKHIPVICDFWDSILFHTATFRGNPMIRHIELHKKKNLEDIHFDRWVELFFATVDELFEGKKVGLLKEKTISMKLLMQYKIKLSENDFFIQ